ncbi:MAG: arsenate reductase (azurin) small subunit [Candidatus Bathyarchaeia archaeon]|jgi:arsenite oxidase small subunit
MGPESDQSRPKHEKSRRNFLKIAISFSTLLLIGGIAALTRSLTNPAPQGQNTALQVFPRVKVAQLNDLQTNQPVLFNYPLDNEPNILVKLGQKAEAGVGPDGDIVAYSVLCQHLGCVFAFQAPGTSPKCNSGYKASSPVGYCCCHGSIFDFLHQAQVVSGPSPRPQPQVILELDGSGNIYAVGMTPPTIFGHNTGSSDVSSDLQGGTPVT